MLEYATNLITSTKGIVHIRWGADAFLRIHLLNRTYPLLYDIAVWWRSSKSEGASSTIKCQTLPLEVGVLEFFSDSLIDPVIIGIQAKLQQQWVGDRRQGKIIIWTFTTHVNALKVAISKKLDTASCVCCVSC